MPFNMNRTWSQAIALVRANFQLLAVIAGVFLLLPSLLFAILMPDTVDWMQLGQNPEALAAAMGGSILPLFAYALISFLLQIVGFGAMIALVGDSRPTVGEAIGRGVRSLPTVIAATLVFVLAYVAIMLLFSALIGLLSAAAAAIGGAGVSGVIAIILMAALVAAVLYVSARLSLTLAVVVLESERNPITALRRSWMITKPSGGAIFGFYVLLGIAYFVISLLLFGLLGVIGAALGEGAASALFMGLVNGLVGAFVGMVMSGIFVSMHRQVAGLPTEVIGRTFD